MMDPNRAAAESWSISRRKARLGTFIRTRRFMMNRLLPDDGGPTTRASCPRQISTPRALSGAYMPGSGSPAAPRRSAAWAILSNAIPCDDLEATETLGAASAKPLLFRGKPDDRPLLIGERVVGLDREADDSLTNNLFTCDR